MQNKFNMNSPMKFTGGILLMAASFSACCQGVNLSDLSTLQAGSVEIVISPQEQSAINQNSLNQSFSGVDDCDRQFPFPVSAQKSNPYGEKESEICKRLQIRGQRMQCEIDALLMEKPVSNTTGAKIELATWARCNGKVANLLMEGYYLPASEIERRLQICSSNYYADPGKIPAPGWYQRFLRWYTRNDWTPPPTDAALEVALKQSTPLESRQDSAGLMKCEWMYDKSRMPQIDPLPSTVNSNAGSNTDKKTPVKKPTKK
jgi:hypothetical protein